MFRVVVVIAVLVYFVAGNEENEGCVLNYTNPKTERNLPVPLFNISQDYQLAVPDHGAIYLKPGQNISLICSGNRNYVKQTQSNVTTITCIENDKVKLFRKTFDFESIQCKKIEKGEVRPTTKKCGHNQGRIYEIGYIISRTDWITLIEVCYVPDIGSTLYTRHLLHGKQMKFASKNPHRPSFSTAGINPEITAKLSYQQVYQKATFSSLLSSSLLSRKYISNSSYLAKGHLSPDADFLLATTQYTTYYYINAAPQWQSVNGASWKSIENTVRLMSTFYGDIEVITGTHGILSYKNKHGEDIDIYLGQNSTIPVPQYFWKIAYEPTNKKAIAFVIINDPFITSLSEKVFCEDICQNMGFDKKSWKVSTTGYVFCCSYDDLRKVVKSVPELEVTDVLLSPSL